MSATTSKSPPLASTAAATTSEASRATNPSAPRSPTAASLDAPAMATTRAPRRLASCTSALPTPPDAPGTATDSPESSPERCSMCSAVDHEQAKLASSTSDSPTDTG